MNNGPSLNTLATWAAFILSIASLGATFGVVLGRVDQNTADITDLKRQQEIDSDKLTDIRLDVREIRSKFEVLVPTDRNKREHDK